MCKGKVFHLSTALKSFCIGMCIIFCMCFSTFLETGIKTESIFSMCDWSKVLSQQAFVELAYCFYRNPGKELSVQSSPSLATRWRLVGT